jgi:hypothetical protein
MIMQIRLRTVLIAALTGAALAALGLTVASSQATSRRSANATAGANPPELPMSNLFTPGGHFAPLKAGVTYQASTFPIPLRVTARDGSWGAGQWAATSHGKRAFGWTGIGRPPLKNPHGDIFIETAFGPTPSVAATIARLRVGGSHLPESHFGGVSFQRPSPVKLAGYSGRQFDGQVWGKFGKVFIPFSPQTHGASPPDSFRFDKGEVFRIIVIDVRGKTVVLFEENWKLPAEQFPAFLTSANRLLTTLEFPG